MWIDLRFQKIQFSSQSFIFNFLLLSSQVKPVGSEPYHANEDGDEQRDHTNLYYIKSRVEVLSLVCVTIHKKALQVNSQHDDDGKRYKELQEVTPQFVVNE